VTRPALLADGRRALDDAAAARFAELVARREEREPLAYVLGSWGFRRLTLRTDRRALVPRPETEVVVERCLELLRDVAEPRVLDVGTGTGAIALALVDEHAGARVTALDRSPAALSLARENAEATGLAARVELGVANLHDGLPAGPWDLVVSNPPYVHAGELDGLEPEVRDWEPDIALVAGGHTESLARDALAVLAEHGSLVLETHAESAGEVAALLEGCGYRDVRITRDLAGRERVVEGSR
jgi:release factor glutamine methyltransferase